MSEFPVPKIFICGYLSKRFHNRHLDRISRSLITKYHVCANPEYDNWSWDSSMQNLFNHSSHIIFYMNQYTLNDQRFGYMLQACLDSNKVLILLQNPNFKLYYPLSINCHCQVSMGFVENVIFDQYMKQRICQGLTKPIIYERHGHKEAMKLICEIIDNMYIIINL